MNLIYLGVQVFKMEIMKRKNGVASEDFFENLAYSFLC